MSGGGGSGRGRARISVAFTDAGAAALHDAARRTGRSMTDTVDRAVQLYAQVAELAQHEGAYRVDVPDFDDRPLYLLTSRQPLVSRKPKWFPW